MALGPHTRIGFNTSPCLFHEASVSFHEAWRASLVRLYAISESAYEFINPFVSLVESARGLESLEWPDRKVFYRGSKGFGVFSYDDDTASPPGRQRYPGN